MKERVQAYILAKKMDAENYFFSKLGKGIVILARSIYVLSTVLGLLTICVLYVQAPVGLSGVPIVLVVFGCVFIEFIGSIVFYFGKLAKL